VDETRVEIPRKITAPIVNKVAISPAFADLPVGKAQASACKEDLDMIPS